MYNNANYSTDQSSSPQASRGGLLEPILMPTNPGNGIAPSSQQFTNPEQDRFHAVKYGIRNKDSKKAINNLALVLDNCCEFSDIEIESCLIVVFLKLLK